MTRQAKEKQAKTLHDFIRKNPGVGSNKLIAKFAHRFGITEKGMAQRLGNDTSLRTERAVTKGRELLWFLSAASSSFSGDPFGPKKQTIRDRKLRALAEYGPKEISLIVTLPGLPLRKPDNHESQVLDLHPEARGYGCEEMREIYDKIYLCPNKPDRYQVFSGKLLSLLEDLEEPIQYGDADFCGGLKPGTVETLRAFFEKMDKGGLLCITLNEFSRKPGGYSRVFGHHKRNNELNLQMEVENAAYEASREVRQIFYEPYVSNQTPMVTIGYVVSGEPTFYEE